MFSIGIPTYNNLDYLKLCLSSIKKNSFYNHEILIHINEGVDGTLNYVKENNFKYTYADKNIGLCSSLNKIFKKATTKYLLYSHDDMYFLPEWDTFLKKELDKVTNNRFYFSGTMIEPYSGHIMLNCGDNINNFDEKKLLSEYKFHNFYDHQGSHFAPHLIEKSMWEKIGGMSEEFNPGIGSDPDLNMKLWNNGVRIFKGINNFKVYHFGSLTTRKNNEIIQNRGDKTFLKKWGITTKFFKKHYLKSRTKYISELKGPIKNLNFYIDFIKCKIKFLFTF